MLTRSAAMAMAAKAANAMVVTRSLRYREVSEPFAIRFLRRGRAITHYEHSRRVSHIKVAAAAGNSLSVMGPGYRQGNSRMTTPSCGLCDLLTAFANRDEVGESSRREGQRMKESVFG